MSVLRVRAVAVAASVMVAAGIPATQSVAAPAHPAQSGGSATASVHIYGKDGTFGDLTTALPSGQSVTTHAVPGWQFAAGKIFQVPALASDGRLLIAGLDQSFNQTQSTGPQTVIAEVDPDGNAFKNITLATTTGETAVSIPHDEANRDGRGGASVSDLEEIDDGNAVAFVSWVTHFGQDVETEGVWPAFGVLTKGVDGHWEVASGDGWTNQWTGQQLRESYPGGTPQDRLEACPSDIELAPGESHCKGLTELESLPVSHDIIATQYMGVPGDDLSSGGLVALRLTKQPSGRYTVRIMGHYAFPTVADPRGNGNHIRISGLSVQADPSSTDPTDERFAVAFDLWNSSGGQYDADWPVMEFSYNSVTGDISPASAPVLGDFKHSVYDSSGNLYAARYTAAAEGPHNMGVFAKVSGQRRLNTPACGFDPANPDVPWESYTTTVDGQVVWGELCRPNYDIVQANGLGHSTEQLRLDPVTGDIITLTSQGQLLAIRPSGSGTDMTFEIGNVVDIGNGVLDGPGARFQVLGPVDAEHRIWLTAGRSRVDQGVEAVDNPYDESWDPQDMVVDGQLGDNWLYSVDLDDLFAAPTTTLPSQFGQMVGIHAEQTATISTQRRAGVTADYEFDSDANVSPCSGACSVDLVPGDGFTLNEDNGWGFAGTVTYRLEVPTAGWYRLGYFAATWGAHENATIKAQVDTNSVSTNVYSARADGFPLWSYIQSDPTTPLYIPAGSQTLTISVTADRAYLNWFTLSRVDSP